MEMIWLEGSRGDLFNAMRSDVVSWKNECPGEWTEFNVFDILKVQKK